MVEPESTSTGSGNAGSRAGSTGPDRPRPPIGADAPGRRRFDIVLRGYDRSAVEDHIVKTAAEMDALRRELAESERRRALAEQHATATESENRTLRSDQQYSERTPPEESFGYRAEKLLRLAEQEAAEARTAAGREAAAVVEQARAEAEQHRHEVEQSLITRSSLLDQQAAQRTAELQEREQQIAAQLATARSEVEAMHESARRAADQHRRQAEGDAETVRARAAHAAQRLRDQAEQEVARLNSLRDDARAEITRLADLLSTELGSKPGQQGGRGQSRSGEVRQNGPSRPGAGTTQRIPQQQAGDDAARDSAGRSDKPSARSDDGDQADRTAAARAVGR